MEKYGIGNMNKAYNGCCYIVVSEKKWKQVLKTWIFFLAFFQRNRSKQDRYAGKSVYYKGCVNILGLVALLSVPFCIHQKHP